MAKATTCPTCKKAIGPKQNTCTQVTGGKKTVTHQPCCPNPAEHGLKVKPRTVTKQPATKRRPAAKRPR